MKLQRAFGLLAAGLAGVLTLAGCDRHSERLKVAFISNNPHEFWTIARSGTEKAAEDFDIDVEFYMPAFGTAAEQHRIVEDLIAKGVGGIAISPNDADNQSRVLNEIIPDQVAFITQDSDLPKGSKRLCYIGTDNIAAGRAVGQLVKEACDQAFPIKERINIMIYVGMLDVQNARERRQGVIAALAGVSNAQAAQIADESYPTKPLGGKYVVLGTMTDEASQDKCKRNVEDTLNGKDEVNCLVGLWAYNPPAMLQAVKDAGKLGQIQMVGFDEDEETLNAIKNGSIYATVVQHPYLFGYEAVRILQYKNRNGTLPEPGGKYQDMVRRDGSNYFVKHRVIKNKKQLRPNLVPGIDVEIFHKELKKLKG